GLAIVLASFLTLQRDASALRQHVMDATDAHWSTKVQVSVGRLTLGAVRQGLRFVHAEGIDDARQALGAIDRASVGVYERTSGGTNWSREELFTQTDQAMQKRGWVRLVGVADHKETVLIYVPQDMGNDDGPVDICLAVVSGNELVVVSTSVNADKLAALIEKHAGKDGKANLRFAKFRF
ncbi:MAG: hypothetical protein PSW75_04730, partial [bacterium]|nr:hypothetical protein [bacterium]